VDDAMPPRFLLSAVFSFSVFQEREQQLSGDELLERRAGIEKVLQGLIRRYLSLGAKSQQALLKFLTRKASSD
jgi:hypothetical protein